MITTAVTNSAKQEFLQGIHLADDNYKIALYDSVANLGADITEYSETNEVSGPGYSAGGKGLSGYEVSLDGDTAILTFATPTWDNATITARGAVIYNASKSNKVLAVFDFGADVTSTNGTFTATIPDATARDGLIRIA